MWKEIQFCFALYSWILPWITWPYWWTTDLQRLGCRRTVQSVRNSLQSGLKVLTRNSQILYLRSWRVLETNKQSCSADGVSCLLWYEINENFNELEMLKNTSRLQHRNLPKESSKSTCYSRLPSSATKLVKEYWGRKSETPLILSTENGTSVPSLWKVLVNVKNWTSMWNAITEPADRFVKLTTMKTVELTMLKSRFQFNRKCLLWLLLWFLAF